MENHWPSIHGCDDRINPRRRRARHSPAWSITMRHVSPSRHATIDSPNSTSDPCIGNERYTRMGNVCGGAQAAERNMAFPPLSHFCIGGKRFSCTLYRHDSRCNAIDANIVLSKLKCTGPSQCFQSCLGNCVRADVFIGPFSVNTSRIK
jgi:hypothetical protein